MKKILLYTSFTLLVNVVKSQDNSINGFSAPESVTSDGQFLYVSNIGVPIDPTGKDNNGFISKLSLDGKMLEEKFIQNLHGPKGMAIIGDILYVTDIDAVLGFDIKSKIKKKNIAFDKYNTKFLNDLVKIDDQMLVVSSTDKNNIYTINFKKGIKTELVKMKGEKLKGPNGLEYDKANDVLYIAEYGVEKELGGFIKVKDFKKNDNLMAEKLFTYKGNVDGLFLKDSMMYFTDWNSTAVEGKSKAPKIGGMFSLDLRNLTEPKIEEVMKPVEGPADFYYDESKKVFYLPALIGNKVHVITLK
jgi:DNA-binding beta-propeller fold protein YncE